MGPGVVEFTSVRPRDTVSSLARLELERDEARRSARAGWIAAYILLAIASLALVLWIVERIKHGASDLRSGSGASGISRPNPEVTRAFALSQSKKIHWDRSVNCQLAEKTPGPQFRGARGKEGSA